MKCRIAVVMLCLTLVACSKPKVTVTPVAVPEIQEPVYRTDALVEATPVQELLVALTLDLKETQAVLRRALGYLRSLQPVPPKPPPK